MRIRDPQLRPLVTDRPVHTVEDEGLLRMLAALADDGTHGAGEMLARLTAPGMDAAARLQVARDGLDAEELADVQDLLDRADLAFTPAGRNFLEALCGRAPLQDPAPRVPVSLDGHGNLDATLLPGQALEVLNLSTAPTGPTRLRDTVAVGVADAWGRFSGQLAGVQPGDVLRLQTRDGQGRVSSWLNVRAGQAGLADPRAAYVNVARLAATSLPGGSVAVEPKSRLPLCEPGAVIRLANTRTGDVSDVTVDANGSLPRVTLPGAPGDTLTVAVSDGGGNTDFSLVAGTLAVPQAMVGDAQVPDPGPLARDAWARTRRFGGPAFPDAVAAADVRQGQIGDCYVPAACAAVAHAEPEAIRDLVRDNGNGTWTVTFHPTGQPPVEVLVDGDLYGEVGRPRYGSGQLWFSLVEKALAQWRGSYEVVGQGGSVGQMLSEILGRPNRELWLSGNSPDQVYDAIQEGTRQRHAMAAGTHGTAESARYTNTGVYPNHAYSVLGAVEEQGRRYVVLRNPWGSGEPAGDGVDDGVFRLPLERFMDLYQVLNVC
jgi:hypothetical protein